jgi:RNA polymerase sigma-70 factor, ECF subfamily
MSAESGLLPDSYRRVLRFARRRVGSIEDAEDVTQEVYANVAMALNARRAEAPTLAWLYTVTKRRLADEAKRGRRSQTIPLELVEEPAAVSAEYGSEVATALSAGLCSMPEGQRRVVVGRLLQDRSFAELGQELGTSEEACRMRFMRGLQHLRDEFTKEGLEP